MLNHFSLAQTVSADTARQDRIDLVINFGTLEGSTRQIDRFRLALNPKPGDFFPETVHYHGSIFRRPAQNDTRRFPQKIRSQKDDNRGIKAPPLFSGELEYGQYYRPDMDEMTRANLRLKLTCNPTRFARHSPPRADGRPPINDSFGYKAGVAPDGEMATDFNDNWIPKGAHNDYYTPNNWRENVRRYLSDIVEVVEQEIRTASNLAATNLIPRSGPRFKFNFIETYWEFESETPTGLVQTFQNELKGFASCGRDTEYANNCLAIRREMRPGLELCIYAKTNRRIRIEVRHNLHKHMPDGLEGKTSSTMIGAMKIVMGCRNEAAMAVNMALQSMRERGEITPSHTTAALLLIKIGRIVRNDNLAIMLVEMLRVSGGIVANNKAAPMRKAIEKLRGKGVLMWNPQSKLWGPTQECAHAVMQLQSRIDTLFVKHGSMTAPFLIPFPAAHQQQDPAKKYPRRNQPLVPTRKRKRDVISHLVWD